MNRSTLALTIRSIDADQRVIRGIATTGSVDRVGDIVEPLGCRFANPLPLLMAHSHTSPVGTVVFGTPTKAGIPFEATFPKIDIPGILKDRVDEAWQSVKLRLIRSVSIGFRSLGDVEPLPGGGLRYLECEILELSLVVVPAQPDAQILEVRQLGRKARGRVVRLDRRAVRATGGASLDRITLEMVRDLPLPTVMRALLPSARGHVLRAIIDRSIASAQGRVVRLGSAAAKRLR